MDPRELLDRTFHRLTTSLVDLNEANQYLGQYNEKMEHVLRRALFSAALVSYSRPFLRSDTGNENRASAKLDGKFLVGLTNEHLALHKKIIDLRNKAVAHSDFDWRPSERLKPSYRDPAVSPGVMTVTTLFDPLMQGIEVASFKQLVQDLTKRWQELKLNMGLELNKFDNLPPMGIERQTYSVQQDKLLELQVPLASFVPAPPGSRDRASEVTDDTGK